MTTIPKIKRQEVWNHYIGDKIGKTKCLCCGVNDITQFEFHCGHVIAKSKGGELNIDNLRPICSKCNLSMRDEYMMDFIKRLGYNLNRINKKLFFHNIPINKDMIYSILLLHIYYVVTIVISHYYLKILYSLLFIIPFHTTFLFIQLFP
jgi:hypothetical protein